jgi:transposase
MPKERTPMRKIKEVLRLKWSAGLGSRSIARSVKIGKTTVDELVRRATESGLSWPLQPEMDEAFLEQLLYPQSVIPEGLARALPDLLYVHRELSRKGVNLSLLWNEYKERHPSGYQYSQFCELYRQYAKKLDLSMRQLHRAGEKLFVDYCGQTIPFIDTSTGEFVPCQIFVAVLGASNYTYAEATLSQSLADWIGSHVRAFSFFGGVPKIVVPDNLRSAVSKSCRYEPELNPTYQDMASHYEVAVVPARVRKPKDKAKVEVAVQIVERWILAALRNRTFFSLSELNAAIRELLEKLNNRPFKKLPGCRKSRFLEMDKPALRPLPALSYQFAQWKRARVHIDYHIELLGHYYSVPYQFIGRELDVRFTESIVECFHKSKRVASHVRSFTKGRHTTVPDHMPKGHRNYAEWSPERLVRWAEETGESTAKLITAILSRHRYPQQGFRSAFGILALNKRFDKERIEAACKRALAIGGTSSRSVRSILETGLDKKPLPEQAILPLVVTHDNIRGGNYYH